MTLILNYLSRDYVIQVSDRRLTRLDGTLFDDRTNKATVFGNRVVFAYTGLAKMDLTRTDIWLNRVLNMPGTGSVSDAASVLCERATNYFRTFAYTPRAKRHAFVGAGWTRSRVDEDLKALLLTVSNFHSALGEEMSAAGRQFDIKATIPSADQLPGLAAFPQKLSRDELLQVLADLQGESHPQAIALRLAEAIRLVASQDTTVGKGLLAVCIPKETAQERGDRVMYVGPLRPKEFGSVYFPEDSNDMVQYAPNFVEWSDIEFGPILPRT